MTYDAWKLRSPDDEYDEYNSDWDYPGPCDHDDTDISWDGEITCESCGAYLGEATAKQRDQMAQWQREYYEAMDREMWRERWLWWWDALRGRCARLFERRRRPKPADINDDIPF